MTELVLQIRPLDFGQKESKLILKHLDEIELTNSWRIESPTEETNSILMFVKVEGEYLEEWELRQSLLKNAAYALKELAVDTIDYIRSQDVDVSFRVVTPEFFVPIDSEVVSECARLGLGIDVFNEKMFSDLTSAS